MKTLEDGARWNLKRRGSGSVLPVSNSTEAKPRADGYQGLRIPCLKRKSEGRKGSRTAKREGMQDTGVIAKGEGRYHYRNGRR